MTYFETLLDKKRVGGQVYGQVRFQANDQVWKQVEDQVYGRVRVLVDDQVCGLVYFQILVQVHGQVRKSL
jgi:hypothetical protein